MVEKKKTTTITKSNQKGSIAKKHQRQTQISFLGMNLRAFN